jgi:quercetin dioxygenase-like cupin family protein
MTASQILKHMGDFLWRDVPRTAYKSDGEHWKGVSRTELVAESATPELPFHVRYFEIEPGGFTSLERHQHEHVVLVTRGRGTVLLGEASKEIGVGDVIHVRGGELHQFRAEGSERFGFYCIVAADRDRPVLEGQASSSCEWRA